MTFERTVTHDTFTIERSYALAPQQVFSAFSDPARKQRWFADGRSSDLVDYELDFRVGGVERTRVRLKEGTPFPGLVMVNTTVYQDIVPNRRIVFAYSMTMGEMRISASLATIEFYPTGTGTTLVFTDQGAYFEGADGVERRKPGWSQLLDNLTKELSS